MGFANTTLFKITVVLTIASLANSCNNKPAEIKAIKIKIKSDHCFHDDSKKSGNVLANLQNIPDHTTCQTKCMEVEDCSLFTHDKYKKICTLLSNFMTEENSPHFVSGRRECSDDKGFSDHPVDPCNSDDVFDELDEPNEVDFNKYLKHRICKISLQKVAKSSNNILKSMYSAIKSSRTGNLVMSQYSVSNFMLFALLGSNGTTRKQILNTMGYSHLDHQVKDGFNTFNLHLGKSDVKFSSENGIFIQRDFPVLYNYEYSMPEVIKNAKIEIVDFNDGEETMDQINTWVSDATENLVENLLTSPPSPNTKLMIANVIFFDGLWKNKFSKDSTSYLFFNRKDGSKIRTSTMTTTNDFRTVEVPHLDAVALELPYIGDGMSMIIFRPNQVNGIDLLESKISTYDFDSLKFGEARELEIFLPKFKIDQTHNLEEPLKTIGLTDMFDPNVANFDRISNKTGLYVSSVYQRALIEVDEEGTKAAAVTYVRFETLSAKTQFRVDRPFFYLIKDNPTGLILFAGRVVDPKEQ